MIDLSPIGEEFITPMAGYWSAPDEPHLLPKPRINSEFQKSITVATSFTHVVTVPFPEYFIKFLLVIIHELLPLPTGSFL